MKTLLNLVEQYYLNITAACHLRNITLFNYNNAAYGGAIISGLNSFMSFKDNCNVIFDSNKADQSGGTIYYGDEWIIERKMYNFSSKFIVAVSFYEFAIVSFSKSRSYICTVEDKIS